MLIYQKDEIKVSTIEESDKDKVLEYFSENDFNCDFETGALRPTNHEFIKIMDSIINDNKGTDSILVLKKNDEVIGYESMFIEFDRLTIGHIAVKKSERNQGYGELLTSLAIQIAENDDRDVTLYCDHWNKYFSKLKFESKDGIHYIHRNEGIKNNTIPKLFLSIDEYKDFADEKRKKDLEKFNNFMKKNKKMLLKL